MNVQQMSDLELLAVVIGKDGARTFRGKRLAEVLGFTKPRQATFGEEVAPYVVHPALAAAKELFTRCLQDGLQENGVYFSNPSATKGFLCSRLGDLEHESFWCLWLDSRSRLIAAEEIFRGSIAEARVYPREIVKRALSHNALSVIFAHNHPSGCATQSTTDEVLTQTLKQALALVEVRVLDHIVVAGSNAVSFAEKGLL
jgi:DNA repair protein radc